jgi:hypothetical protein
MDYKYAVHAVLPDGTDWDITPGVTKLSWQDPDEEVAQRANITVAQTMTKRGWLHSQLQLCVLVKIFANGQEVFRGIIWEWEYDSSSKTREINLTCYDHFIYTQKSRDFGYYAAGKSTNDIISDICSKNGIKLQYDYQSIKHAKTVFKNKTIADQILYTLDEAKKKLKSEPVAIFDKQVLIVREKGANTDVYSFKSDKNTVSTTERLTMDRLVTKVVVIGKEDSAGRRSIEATVNGKLEYGTLQEVVYRDGDDTIAAAKDEAQKILDDRGKPESDIRAEVPDVPTMRKGDKVHMEAGSLNGFFFVRGVTHNAETRSMSLELERM